MSRNQIFKIAFWANRAGFHEDSLSFKGFGFGSWFGDGRFDDYRGKASIITNVSKRIEQISVYMAHYIPGGWHYVIENPFSPPPLPFLVTDNTEMQVIYDGKVEFVPEADDAGGVTLGPKSLNSALPIRDDQWIGVLTYVGISSDGRQRADLIAFSSALSSLPRIVRPFFPDWDLKVGEVTLLDNNDHGWATAWP